MISRSDLPQLNIAVIDEKRIPYEYLRITPVSIKPIQSDRLPFDDNHYLRRYTKIINDTYNPLIIDKDFNLIDGHQRYDIIRRMDPPMTSVRVLQLGISYQTVIDLFKNSS